MKKLILKAEREIQLLLKKTCKKISMNNLKTYKILKRELKKSLNQQ